MHSLLCGMSTSWLLVWHILNDETHVSAITVQWASLDFSAVKALRSFVFYNRQNNQKRSHPNEVLLGKC